MANYGWLLVILVVGLISDVLMKLGAINHDKVFVYALSVWAIWGVSVYPWIAAIRSNGIITFTVLFTIAHIIISTAVGMYYGESMQTTKVIGVILAIIAAILITRS